MPGFVVSIIDKQGLPLPMRLNTGNYVHNSIGTVMPYFVFASDVNELNDADFTSFDYIQRDELNQLAKVLAKKNLLTDLSSAQSNGTWLITQNVAVMRLFYWKASASSPVEKERHQWV